MTLADCMETIKNTNIDARAWDVQIITCLRGNDVPACILSYTLNDLYYGMKNRKLFYVGAEDYYILSLLFVGCGKVMMVSTTSLSGATVADFMDLLHCSRFEIIFSDPDAHSAQEESDMIVSASFTSVWDGGVAITTNCKVNMQTKEVFNIETSEETADFVNVLDGEYVEFQDGRREAVVSSEQLEGRDGFWYQD